MENISRDNLIDQLHFMIGEVKRRPREAYFAVPEFAIVQIDAEWMKQVSDSTTKRLVKLQKEQEKRQRKLKDKKDNI